MRHIVPFNRVRGRAEVHMCVLAASPKNRSLPKVTRWCETEKGEKMWEIRYAALRTRFKGLLQAKH